MKIGINTYLAANNFGEGNLIGISTLVLNHDDVIDYFGNTLKYSEMLKLYDSEPSTENELIVKKFGSITIKVFKLEK